MKKELTFGKNGLFLLLVFASGMLFSGCRKDKHNPIGFKIDAYMPHTNEPVAGIKWKVIERKYKGLGVGHETTGWTMEGETDANGQATGEFPPRKNLDFSYIIQFDYSAMALPNGEYSVTKGPTDYAILDRASATVNSYEIRILPKMGLQINYQNTDCFDNYDTFKYKSYNYDELHNFTQTQVQSMPWTESTLFDGCVNYTSTPTKLAGHYIYIWEAVRNGITETGVDTFFVAPGINSTINMHW